MAVDVERARRRFSIEEYETMAATGILAEDDRVELIDGEIVEMSPIGDLHAAAVATLTNLLKNRVGDRAWLWVQGPVRVPPRSKPQPDVALLRVRAYRHEGATTSDALLFIEVADTSLQYDRTVKLRLYAHAGIPEYWIADVNTDTLEVYRSPSGDGYANRQVLGHGESIAPLAFPDAAIPIDAIFA
jgi:Uma2 family endonuclease